MRRVPTTRAAVVALSLSAGCAKQPPAVVVVEIPAALPAPSAEPAPPGPPPPVLGHWEGRGVQESGASWDILVDLVALGPGLCGHARYPTEPCAADWICTARSDGRALRAREHLTAGREACIDGGEMTMEVTPAGTLAWHWVGSGEEAHAELSRAPTRR